MRKAASLLAASGLLSSVFAAPAPAPNRVKARQESAVQFLDNTNNPTATPYGPSGASGSLRGGSELLGFNPTNVISSYDPGVVASSAFSVGPLQTADADTGFYLDLSKIENPQPIRGAGGKTPTDPGPRNVLLEKQNPDLYIPPGTDAGDVANAKWPLGLSHNRHGKNGAGWARQQNVDLLPVAKNMAGVDMHLEPYAYRELHWHQANEWSYIMNGSVRINAVNEAGETFTDDLSAGDVWFFPAGIPHSIQAGPTGVEFLLVFDEGSFSEDNTFLLSELFARNPKSVLAKDLRIDISALDHIPQDQLYIFNGSAYPANVSDPLNNITGPAGVIPNSKGYSYHLSEQAPYEVPGGSVKILDTLTFPAAFDFAVGLFTIKPGAMRELHWHTTSDEWDFILSGQGRLTLFQAPQASRTFDFQAGDVGYVPVVTAHYLENTGTEDLVYIEVLQAPVYNDVSVAQWLGLTPKQVVKEHLGFSDDTLNRLPKIKPFILPGSTDLGATNFTAEVE
ncbi:oxalate decarboxylase, secreted [Aureobasidium sp. EXF-8845]|nr:oxalate decarboxylase, secreted [Aureobasidium sp. EXF-8845]KAI4855606.1 oxalate decarboxylase, secreted [Aureobasidium sp. EXF-8846]